MSLHVPGPWFPCSGSTWGKALIRQGVRGQVASLASEPLWVWTWQLLLCSLGLAQLWAALIWGCLSDPIEYYQGPSWLLTGNHSLKPYGSSHEPGAWKL